ncbi:MAG: prepilin-type N-terminal cleavage/methylation domain-containing protein [Candidatus Paceibacterota bacterium]
MSKRGFTLIELLVVISIIGLFSSIIVAGVSTLRSRAQEATIKSDLKSIKTQAELSFNNTGDYSTASAAVNTIIEGINKSGGTATFYTLDNTHYAVSAKLNSDPTKSWSVSDQGNIVVWDTTNQSTSNWNTAVTACANSGGRLPAIEELKSFFDAGGKFLVESGAYWSSTADTNLAQGMYPNGIRLNANKVSNFRVRCVR